MRIGLYNSYKVWGGGEKWHFEMASLLIQAGHEVVFFGPDSDHQGELAKRLERELSQVKIQHSEITDKSYLNPFHHLALKSLFSSYRLDLMVFNSYRDIRAAGIAAKMANIPRTVLRVGTPIAPKEKLSYRLAFQKGLDEIVGISKACLDVFREDSPSLIEGKKLHIITNGVDTETFYPAEGASRSNQEVIFGNCCRLTDQKGVDLFLKACETLKKQNLSFRAKIAGDGELKEELFELREKLGLASEVEFIGHVESPAAFYRELDFVLFSSKYEGTARTILEGFATGLPVIAFNTSSMKEMIDEDINGYLVPPFEEKALAQAAKTLIEDQKKRLSMGEKARQKVLQNYDKKDTYKEWLSYLTSDKGQSS